MRDIAIYGAGGFGKEVGALIHKMISHDASKWNFIGYFDDQDLSSTLGSKYLGGATRLNAWTKPLDVVLALGWSHHRKQVFRKINNPYLQFPNIISPDCILGDQTAIKMGIGCLVMDAAVLTTHIEMGDFVVININASIGHDVKLQDFVGIMPAANISGNVTIEEEAFIGTGSTILNGLTIGSGAIVGAGAMVNKPVGSKQTVVGVPAKAIRAKSK